MRKKRRARVIVFLVLVVMGVALKVSTDVLGYRDGKALRLAGEQNFITIILMGCAAFLLGITAAILGLWELVRRGVWARRLSWPHLVGLMALVMVFFVRPYDYMEGIRAGFMPIDDAAYVSFAQQTRSLFGSEVHGFMSLSEPRDNTVINAEEAARIKAFSTLLASSVLARWPQAYTKVRIDEESVWLERGGGFQSIGVRIFDQPVFQGDYSTLRRPANTSYMPTELGLSKRVVFTSD